MKDKLRFLQIDTSNEEFLFLKLYDNGIENHMILKEKRCHLKKLVPSIQEILRMRNIKLNELSFIALNEGPGSWTGLRIGFSTVKILSQVNNLKVITYSNFEKAIEKSKTKVGVYLVKSSNENYYYNVLNNHELIEQGIVSDKDLDNLYPTLEKFYQDEKDDNLNNILFQKYTSGKFADSKMIEPYYIVEGVIFNKFEK